MLFVAFVFASLSPTGPCGSAEQLTVMGIVNEDRQIMDDNDHVYVIGDNQMGRELRLQVEKRLKVSGTLETVDDEMVFMVSAYEIIED